MEDSVKEKALQTHLVEGGRVARLMLKPGDETPLDD